MSSSPQTKSQVNFNWKWCFLILVSLLFVHFIFRWTYDSGYEDGYIRGFKDRRAESYSRGFDTAQNLLRPLINKDKLLEEAKWKEGVPVGNEPIVK